MSSKKFTCHSGGALGSDITWENTCKKYNIFTFAYSFKGHNQQSANPVILTDEQLQEGFLQVQKASKSLDRNINYISDYIKKLLSRNWFQVKNSEAVYAIGIIQNNNVNGGTGWAVQMSIDNKKPTFVFQQIENMWYKYDYTKMLFVPMYDEIPVLTEEFAGIGTREINDNGIEAIKNILAKNIK